MSELLDEVGHLSVAKLKEILQQPLPDVDEGLAPYIAVAKVQLVAAETALRTVTKTNENALRKRGQDLIPKLMQMIREEQELLTTSPV